MKSTFSLSFFLKRTAVRKTGEMPVIGRITVNGKAVEFRSGLSVKPEDWSVEKGRATGRTPDVIRLNEMLDAARNAVTQHYQRLLTEDGYVTAEKVRDAYLGRDEKALKKRRRKGETIPLYWTFSTICRGRNHNAENLQPLYPYAKPPACLYEGQYGVTDICLNKK